MELLDYDNSQLVRLGSRLATALNKIGEVPTMVSHDCIRDTLRELGVPSMQLTSQQGLHTLHFTPQNLFLRYTPTGRWTFSARFPRQDE